MATIVKPKPARREAPELQLDDSPHPSGNDRYAIYAVFPGAYGDASEIDPRNRRRLAETSQQGIGLTLATLREDGDITNDTRVGILDRAERTWLVNPWAAGR